MQTHLEVILTPAEIAVLPTRNLSRTVCVVLDVLRATTTMVTALANGAHAILPVQEIADALQWRRQMPHALLAGEREGVRISGALAGGVEFDLGNSPREFTPSRVGGRTLVMTTTNGTRALRACAGARTVYVAALVNLAAVVLQIVHSLPDHLLVVCSGTVDLASYEDTVVAGALCERVWPPYEGGIVADSAHIARAVYDREKADLRRAFGLGRNGRRLLARPELAGDMDVCAQPDVFDLAPVLHPDGSVRPGPARIEL